jgi:hypothetical protein
MWLVIIIILDGFLHGNNLKQGFWGEILILVEKSPILRIVSYLVNMDRFEYFFACGL